MDSVSVLGTIWRQRLFAVPVLLLTLAAAFLLFQYGPRQYEATTNFALVNPDVPSETELEENPSLKRVNSDNPYLRAANPTLITDVLITRLSSAATAEEMRSQGLSTEYTVSRGGVGNGFVIDIVGVGSSPLAAQESKRALSTRLVDDLRTIQEVYGADPTYHFEAILIADSPKSVERFSSRLRTVVGVLLAGGILMVAAVSLGEWTTTRRRGRASSLQLPRERASRRHRRSSPVPMAGGEGTGDVAEHETAAPHPSATAAGERSAYEGRGDLSTTRALT